MRLTVVVVLVWLVPLLAWADSKGVALYEQGEYAKARRALEDELRTPGLLERERATTRTYLAAALYAMGAQELATTQLEELALRHPEQQVDPDLFPPAFVELAEQARARVRADRKRIEAELRDRADRERQDAFADTGTEPLAEPVDANRSRLRPELFAFTDPLGAKAAGVGGGLTYGAGSLEVGARVLLGDNLGAGLEAGLLFGEGWLRPRLGLRGTAIPGLSAFGGGAVAGLRMGQGSIVVLVDVGAEYFTVPDDKPQYRNLALTASAGFGFDLLAP